MSGNSSETLTSISKYSFHWYDYVFFCVMLFISVAIGVYYGFLRKKNLTPTEYMMGNKDMKGLPVAISITACHISGVNLLGVPADAYRFGGSYLLGVISMVFVIAITIFIYVPVFFELQITSIYGYLEMRFDKKTKAVVSFLYICCELFYLPIVVYAAALTLSAATGFTTNLQIIIVCCICIFYTSVGGLRAVIWTDIFQFLIFFTVFLVVFVLGIKTEGLLTVWNKTLESGRLDIFNLDLDLTDRNNVWTSVIGLTFHWIALNIVNQATIQKILTVSSLTQAKLYSSCDPFTTKQVEKNDQLVPHYVMDIAGNTGLPGIFVCGIISAALSTLSANVNAMAGVIYQDFLKDLIPNVSERTKCNILKLLVVAIGIWCMCISFVIVHSEGIVLLQLTSSAVYSGPVLGIFTLGVLFPRVNANGAFYGAMVGFITIFLLAVPSKFLQSQGKLKVIPKPLSTDRCNVLNHTFIPTSPLVTTDSYTIFKITPFCYTFIGASVTLIVGLVISYFTKCEHLPNEALLSPVTRFILTRRVRKAEASYTNVEEALKQLQQAETKDVDS
ncbi:sodium-coupled monocarboxylate transporter 2 isoform X2 [Tribolium castaneum]|uniref:sodium-coupled monocarboxylate transporter 2 isoform X2 n=1 Tax=Tribolium castaneum TaxID=7070 RepID=UPI00077DBAF4|nr:PREDICTED: sodium-coupled monocarboxylate transporter 2-like isoform X2 [Tribolium castaneum]|eukprot:XP_015837590.1 PREDICTED: sodium-coupled monocarboxylate transporter 2-like isoform X2 [Tribolium castaneum]